MTSPYEWTILDKLHTNKQTNNHWSDVQWEPLAPSRDLAHFVVEKDKLSFYNPCKFDWERERERERDRETDISDCMKYTCSSCCH